MDCHFGIRLDFEKLTSSRRRSSRLLWQQLRVCAVACADYARRTRKLHESSSSNLAIKSKRTRKNDTLQSFAGSAALRLARQIESLPGHVRGLYRGSSHDGESITAPAYASDWAGLRAQCQPMDNGFSLIGLAPARAIGSIGSQRHFF